MKTVWTNGCFDLLHAGHLEFLSRARALGDHLVVWLNSDVSVANLKGLTRPIVPEVHRAAMLRALRYVDEVRVFDGLTPVSTWDKNRLMPPSIYVKEAGAGVEASAEAAWLLHRGVAVAVLPRVLNLSTTGIIEKCRRTAPSSSTVTAPSSTTEATSAAPRA